MPKSLEVHHNVLSVEHVDCTWKRFHKCELFVGLLVGQILGEEVSTLRRQLALGSTTRPMPF